MPTFLAFRAQCRAALRAALLASACALLAALPARAQTLTLDEAVRLALTRSRGLAATQAQADAARETAVAAGQRPDPVLKLGINNLPLDGPDRGSLTRDFMTMRTVAVMQELTRADKRQARAARAAAEGQVAGAAAHQVSAELQRDTALAWLERSYQQSLRDLLQAQEAQAERQVQAVEAQYRGRSSTLAEVFAARAEQELLRDRIEQSDRAIAVATTQLARWVGVAAEQPLAARPAFARPVWTDGELASHIAAHPMVAAAVQQEVLAAADVALARANRRADWTVELMYSQRGPSYSNMLSLNLAVPLQWDRSQRQDRELAAASAMARRAAAEREERERAEQALVRAMLQEWRSHEQRLARYDASLLPLAGQRRDAALAAYRAGSGGSLTAVLEARRAEIDTQAERLRIELDIARLWAQLNYLMPPGDASAPPATARSPQ